MIRCHHLPVKNGHLPVSNRVNALQSSLPLIYQTGDILHSFIRFAHSAVVTAIIQQESSDHKVTLHVKSRGHFQPTDVATPLSLCRLLSKGKEYLWSLGVYFRSSPSCRGYLQIFWTGVSKKPAMEMSIICWRRRQASKKCLYLPDFMRRCSSAQAAGCVLQ